MRVSFTGGPQTIAERARKAFQLASQEAHRLNHDTIGPEHLLLGLAKETVSPAARALREAGFGLQWLRQEVERRHPADAVPVQPRATLPYSAELDAFVNAVLGAGQSCGALRLTPELLLLALVESPGGGGRDSGVATMGDVATPTEAAKTDPAFDAGSIDTGPVVPIVVQALGFLPLGRAAAPTP